MFNSPWMTMVTNDMPRRESGDNTQENAVWYKWLFGQPAYIILLFSITFAIGYGTWYGLPAALENIQKGYQDINTQHHAERKEMREEAKADRMEFKSAIELNTRALERVADKIDANNGK